MSSGSSSQSNILKHEKFKTSKDSKNIKVKRTKDFDLPFQIDKSATAFNSPEQLENH